MNAADENSGRFDAMIGVGGIGSGLVLALTGNHTLGREESRSCRLLQRKDYCKLHILAHYVHALTDANFHVIPIGAVGNDAVGEELLLEMARDGLDCSYVRRIPERSTLFCVCFGYQDGSGGNLTTDDSASSRVIPAVVEKAEDLFARHGPRCIALAAPEVPLETRETLLNIATKHGCFRAASFVSEEFHNPLSRRLLENIDLLAVNRDEAAHLTGQDAKTPPEEVALALSAWAVKKFPKLVISLTAGVCGSWVLAEGKTFHLPSLPVTAVSTGGAGDAHLSGLLAGLAAGLNLECSHWVGSLTAALSVTSPHTIHKGIHCRALRDFANEHQLALPPAVITFLNP
ncbi:MAG: PfkB family carbohydrate kinase [Verrucomicrobiota bacterium]